MRGARRARSAPRGTLSAVLALACIVNALREGAGAEADAGEGVPLLFAAGEGDAERVRELLEGGADPRATNEHGETALHTAAIGGSVDVVRLLLGAGADPNARAHAGDTLRVTPLHWWAYGGDVDALEALLEHGADATLADEQGLAAAAMAERAGHEAAARTLSGAAEQRRQRQQQRRRRGGEEL